MPTNPPTHVERWGAIPRDEVYNDYSRTRGIGRPNPPAPFPPFDGTAKTDLGKGLTQATYVDVVTIPCNYYVTDDGDPEYEQKTSTLGGGLTRVDVGAALPKPAQ